MSSLLVFTIAIHMHTYMQSFTGRQFAAMSLEEKKKAIFHARLFSRTEPMHKKEIVQLLQVKRIVYKCMYVYIYIYIYICIYVYIKLLSRTEPMHKKEIVRLLQVKSIVCKFSM